METSKDKIKNDKYRNWVKGTLGIEQTNRAVGEYVKEKFILYLQGKATLNPQTNQSYLTPAELAHVRNDIKALFRQRLKSLLTYKRNKTSGREEWHWDIVTYNCKECIGTFQKILSLHKGQLSSIRTCHHNSDYKNIHWGNSNDTRNLPLEWAIAKIFMPMGNEKNSGPDDTDPSAMFSLMSTCDLFTNCIRGRNLQHLIDARNSLFHSPDNLVSDDTVEDYFSLMINLLGDASNDPEVDQSIRNRISEEIKKIEKLKESDMAMTLFEDAQKAIRIARKAIYNDFEERLCNNDPDQLRELLKLAVKLGSELQFLNDHFDDLKRQNEQVKELQKEVNEQHNVIENLKKRSEEQQHEITKMKDHLEEKDRKILEIDTEMNEQVAENDKLMHEVNNSKKEISNMQVKFSKLQQQYDDKESEIKDIIRQRDQHQSKFEQLRLSYDEQKNESVLLQKELEEQNLKIEDLNGQMLGKTKELQTKDNEIEVLSNERRSNLTLIEDLKKQNEDQRFEIERKCDENIEIHREIEKLQEQVSNKEGTITEQKREIHSLSKQITEQAVEIKAVLKENQDRLVEIKELEQKIFSLQESSDQLRNQTFELKKQINQMSTENAVLVDEMKTLQCERDDLYGNVQELKEELDHNKVGLENCMRQARAHLNEIEEIRKQKDNTEWEAVVIISAFALGSFLLQGK